MYKCTMIVQCFRTDVTPVNTNPFVNVSLENKPSNSTRFRPVEPVFKCVFDEPDGSPYWYDTHHNYSEDFQAGMFVSKRMSVFM